MARSTTTARFEGAERLIVVVNPVVGQTFGGVLRVNGVDPDALIEAYGAAHVCARDRTPFPAVAIPRRRMTDHTFPA